MVTVELDIKDEHYTLEELEEEETISEGYTGDLKMEYEVHGTRTRIWLERTGIADGEPYDNKVTVEKYIDGRWQTVEMYEAE